MPGWHAELAATGWPLPRLQEHLDQARRRAPALPLGLTEHEVDRLTGEVLAVDGDLLRNRKVFTRTNLIAEVAPRLYGRHPAELGRVIGRILGRP